jgi:hypothetical protein
MRALLPLFVVATLCGCGEDELTCSQSDRDGTYLAETSERSGTCGDAGSMLVQMDNGSEVVETGCTTDYERWSDGNCTNESSVTCESPADNIVVVGVGVVTQEDSGGESFSGIMTMTIYELSSGALLCTSTYDVTYTRQ